MAGTLTRPNSNPILDRMRDSADTDRWGWAMSWAFAVCEVLYDADPNSVPPEMGFRPAMGGVELPWLGVAQEDVPYEHLMVAEYLHGLEYDVDAQEYVIPDDLPYWADPTFETRHRELVTAARCLSRYIDWLRAAGEDY